MYFNALSGGTGGRDMLYSKNNGRASPYSYMFGFYQGGRIAAYDGVTWREPSPAVTIAAGQWIHAAFSFDGTTLSFFTNGVAVGTSSFSFSNNTGHSIKLGGYDNPSDINGMMTDVRVWAHARSQSQI